MIEAGKGGRCEAHLRQVQRESDQRRGSRHERGYTSKWAKASKAFQAQTAKDQLDRIAAGDLPLPPRCPEFPLCQCEDCAEGLKRALHATVTDHKVPHRGDQKLFWNRNNWQVMAVECHNRKTAREDGGFGNRAAAA